MTTTYSFNRNYLFSFALETKLGTSVMEIKPATGTPEIITFSQTDANQIYAILTNTSGATYTNQLSLPNSNKFDFRWYPADGSYYKWENAPNTIKKVINRNFVEATIKEDLLKLDKFKALKVNFTIDKSAISKKEYTINLDYKIPKLGWALDASKRRQNQQEIFQKIDLGNKTKHEDMKRIIKIMSFILARERGYAWNEAEGTFESLRQRELSIMCWSMINMCNSDIFKNGKNLLKLLVKGSYVDPDNEMNDQEDETPSQNVSMLAKYKANINESKNGQNFEYFVLAFFAGWVNQEIPGVTNWSHIKGLSNLSGFHLPNSPKFEDPDLETDVLIQLYARKDDKGNPIEPIEGEAGKAMIKLKKKHTTITQSKSSTFSLDGDGIFTVNA